MSEEDKKRVKLVRMPDGSIRPATDVDADIGDVWATQQQIREQEAKDEILLKQQTKMNRRQLKKARSKTAPTTVDTKSSSIAKVTEAANPSVVPQAPNLQWSTYRHQGGSEPRQVAPPPVKEVATKEIAISLSIPKLGKPKLPRKHVKKSINVLKTTPKWAYVLVALLVLPAFIVTMSVVNKHKPSKKEAVAGSQASTVPEYKTLAPNGDVTDTTSQKITYDASKKVASFTDKISGYEVTISMQPIPSTFKPAIGENVKKVAEQFAANTVLNVDNGAAYLGTSAKGPQSFVGYRGDLLVFMKSEAKIDNKAWVDYFNSLK